MSLYAKLEKQSSPLKYYSSGIKRMFAELSVGNQWKSSVLFPDDVLDSNPLIIIISTTKGLCGSLNSNLFKYIERSVFVEGHQVPRFVVIGQKAKKFISQKDWGSVLCSYNELNSGNYLTIADDLVERIMNSGVRYSSVVFYSNTLKNFFVQRPQKATLIPVSLNKSEDEGLGINNLQADLDSFADEIIWEQSKEEILDYISIRYLRSFIINVLFQGLVSEYSARFLAMDSSNTNAEKILEKLTMQYNKMRQALITKEVSELSAGTPDE